MSWLNSQPRELLEATVLHTPTCLLFSQVDGKILWANDAFLRWIGYTLNELQQRTWMDISVDDVNLEADLAAAKALDGYQQSYTVQKQYIPKQSRPYWGTLSVLRYPPIGLVECCICVWKPLEEQTEKSYAIAKEAVDGMQTELQDLQEILRQIDAGNQPNTLIERAMVIALKVVVTYPKSSMIVGLFFLFLLGGSAAINAVSAVKKIMTGDLATP